MRLAPRRTSRSRALSAQRPSPNRSTPPPPPPSSARRERREALRRGPTPRSGRPGAAKPPIWKSPTAIVTGLAVVVALVFIVLLVVKPGSSGTGGSGVLPLGLVRPLSLIPASIPRDGRTVGSPTATVTLDEWEDFQCTACGRFSETVEPSIVGRFLSTGAIKMTYHDYFVIGPESTDAATAARCADEQGKFWDYHGWLFANQNGENQGWFSRERLAAIAGQLGLDATKWNACYDSGAARQAATAEADQGKKLGLNSTPTLMIGGKILTFTTADDLYAQIQAAVDAAGGSSAAPSTTAVPSASTAP
jgi:protein-disulfide isomerase